MSRTLEYASDESLLATAIEDYWFLADSANDDLANVATDRHLTCNDHCPKCQDPTSVTFCKFRAQCDISTLRNFRTGAKDMYLDLGARYHQLDFSQKAKFAHDDRCALAHQQFWISQITRSSDPFFAPMENVKRLCKEAGKLIRDSKTHADIKGAFALINEARADAGRTIKLSEELMSGVELMVGAKSKHRENKILHDGLLSREAMISLPKAMQWFERREDWQEKAMEATYQACLGYK